MLTVRSKSHSYYEHKIRISNKDEPQNISTCPPSPTDDLESPANIKTLRELILSPALRIIDPPLLE